MSNSVGRNDNFLAKAQKLSLLQTSLDIFDKRQHYLRILYLSYVLDNITVTSRYPGRF